MRDLLFIFSSEKKMLRDYTLIALALAGGFYALAHLVGNYAGTLASAVQPMPTMQTAPARQYTVTRSILDENPATGSIKDLNTIKIEPCGK